MENGKKNSSTSPEEAHCRRHTDGPPGTPPASSRPSTSPGGKMGRTICDHQDLVLRQLPLRPPLHREREAQRRLPDSCLVTRSSALPPRWEARWAGSRWAITPAWAARSTSAAAATSPSGTSRTPALGWS
ncbi:uncharacterized protein LOC121982268 isoform X2 [Zingiber officinale]|uniref:uncharacterized protein LOC121982268 isoform X2 n=1 Tax=Zingiber officinale TaxID=94328 RepID=UPI001C4C4CAE|nr:uncharacterized protein LOC121982268 isoform X2 [Zingiber officinale]